MGQVPDGGVAAPARVRGAEKEPAPLAGSPWRDPRFRTLAAGMALALFAQIGLLAHLVSLLVPAMGTQAAGLAAGLATAAAILGRQLAGWLLAPGTDRRAVAAACLLVQAAGCGVLLLAGGSVPLLLVGSLLFGAGIGNATSLPPLIAQAGFARADVARVTALAIATAQGAYAFAPGAFGLLRGALGDPAVLVGAIVVQGAAAATYLAGWERRTHG